MKNLILWYRGSIQRTLCIETIEITLLEKTPCCNSNFATANIFVSELIRSVRTLLNLVTVSVYFFLPRYFSPFPVPTSLVTNFIVNTSSQTLFRKSPYHNLWPSGSQLFRALHQNLAHSLLPDVFMVKPSLPPLS
jgi:hypothetical protein